MIDTQIPQNRHYYRDKELKNEMSEIGSEPLTKDKRSGISSGKKVIRTDGGMEFQVDSKYSLIKCIGEGSYGVVISVDDTTTGEKYAIKKIPNVLADLGNGFRVYREIKIMNHCNHPNILSLINVSVVPDNRQFTDLYMTMELMETDLCRVIYSKQQLTDDHIQYFIYQILCGLKYLHSADIIHRDLKPSNLLVNSNCDLKICDFNLAREELGSSLTEYVQTRWYRAPEVMLSSQQYTRAVDIWSVGCIMGELLLRKVLFKGMNYLHQIELYCRLLGCPSDSDLTFITNSKGLKYIKQQNFKPKDFKTVFPMASPLCLDLLQKMLVINPLKRITVEEALAHPYFADFHDEAYEPICQHPFVLGTDDSHMSIDKLRVVVVMWCDV